MTVDESLNKVVASIFVDKNVQGGFERDKYELIALASGTKHKRSNEGIKDMHAEILVRRALNRWLIDTQYTGHENYRFHLYVSSAPCGNACIRRWATVKKETAVEDAEIFATTHDAISLHALKEGQVSLTVKKEGEKDAEEYYPTGVGKYDSSGILSCSDKIALLNTVGWTKVALLGIIPRVDLASITIGRKFARPHAQRALCCRLQNAKLKNLNHPIILCSAVKLDDGGRDEDSGFSHEVFIWSAERQVEKLNFQTGFTVTNEQSIYSTACLIHDAGTSLRSLSDDAVSEKIQARQYLLKYSI